LRWFGGSTKTGTSSEARSIPVLIHELEYCDEIAEQNLAANPAGVVPDAFVSWCRGE
jgi:hypothetical protein